MAAVLEFPVSVPNSLQQPSTVAPAEEQIEAVIPGESKGTAKVEEPVEAEAIADLLAKDVATKTEETTPSEEPVEEKDASTAAVEGSSDEVAASTEEVPIAEENACACTTAVMGEEAIAEEIVAQDPVVEPEEEDVKDATETAATAEEP